MDTEKLTVAMVTSSIERDCLQIAICQTQALKEFENAYMQRHMHF